MKHAVMTDILLGWSLMLACLASWNFNSQSVHAQAIATVSMATSNSFNPGPLAADACASQTTVFPGVMTGNPVIASPVTDPGPGIIYQAWASSANQVTIRECALSALTPTASNFTLRAFR